MSRSGNRDRKTHQTWWEDLEPWVEQLYYEHGYQTSFTVHLHAAGHGLKPAVVMNLAKPAEKPGDVALISDWRVFNPAETGAAESAALFLLSRALLTLDNEKASASLRQPSLWD